MLRSPCSRASASEAAIGGGEERRLTFAAAAPDRADGVDNVAGGQTVAAVIRASPVGQPPIARHSARSSGPGGAMDRAVDAAAAEQALVRRVDDGVDVERGDVGDDDGKRHSAVHPRRRRRASCR